MQESTFQNLESMFLALGDKTRLRLLALMADGPVAVGFLADRLGESQPKVSRHLAYLRNAGLVSTQRDGKWIYYGINFPANQALRHILANVIRSIAVVRVSGEDVFFTGSEERSEDSIRPENNIYGEADRNEDTDAYFEARQEIEIFLL